MWMRYAAALAMGALVTLGVLFSMQALIATPRSNLDDSGSRHFVDFVRVERQEIVQRKDRKPDKPAQVESPPTETVQPRVDSIEPTLTPLLIPAPSMDVDVSVGGLGLVVSDSDYLPLVKIEPPYPLVAVERGIEGYCIVEYTVTAAGSIKDVVVIDAEPKGIFDKVSIEAALKFKYKPRVIDGELIEVRGVRNIFRFELKEQ